MTIYYDNLRQFAYCNDQSCKQPIRGIVLSFLGLGGALMYEDDTPDGRFYAEHGMLYMVPYTNPWSWMNRDAVATTDKLVDVLFKTFALPDDTPVISTGGSMGGQSALVYMAYARRTPTACAVNCPVCDLPYHYTERNDLPRTLHSAFGGYDMPLEDALKTASPLHLVEQLPQVPYCFFHCEEDLAVNKAMHSDRLVAAMDGKFDVTYYAVPNRGHCDLPEEDQRKFHEFILAQL